MKATATRWEGSSADRAAVSERGHWWRHKVHKCILTSYQLLRTRAGLQVIGTQNNIIIKGDEKDRPALIFDNPNLIALHIELFRIFGSPRLYEKSNGGRIVTQIARNSDIKDQNCKADNQFIDTKYGIVPGDTIEIQLGQH